jgi:CubicO group peptidase (beta-lactamase class C family)
MPLPRRVITCHRLGMTDGDALKTLDAALAEYAGEHDFSGVATIVRGGVTEFEACYGLANRAEGVPIRPGTRFGLASLTKMFTAVAVADLVRSGALSFDRPVVDILPPERRPATLRPDVTVHHLLSHTAGIADYFEEEDEANDEPGAYAELWATRPLYRVLRPADFLPLFGDLPPYRAPGGRFQYSNAGYIVLGLVIEEAAGEPYTEAVAHRVFEPAGMVGSGFFPVEEAHPDIATGYLPPVAPGAPWRSNVYSIPPVGGADGGALSNAPDLDRFLTAYDDGTLLGDLRGTMMTPYAEVIPGLHMGYGVMLYGEGRTRRFGHGGGDPGYEVFAMRYPELDTNAVVLTNLNGQAGDVRNLVVAAIQAVSA